MDIMLVIIPALVASAVLGLSRSWPRLSAGPTKEAAVLRPMTGRRTPSMPSLKSDERRGYAVSVHRREDIELEGPGKRSTP
jgi:hypothetical protein